MLDVFLVVPGGFKNRLSTPISRQRRLGEIVPVGKDPDRGGVMDWWRRTRAVDPVIRFSVALMEVRGVAPKSGVRRGKYTPVTLC